MLSTAHLPIPPLQHFYAKRIIEWLQTVLFCQWFLTLRA
jgi:hypothetical protein